MKILALMMIFFTSLSCVKESPLDRRLTKENFENTINEIRKKSSKEEFERVIYVVKLNYLSEALGKGNILLGKTFNEIFKQIDDKKYGDLTDEIKTFSQKERLRIVKTIKENEKISQKIKNNLVKDIESWRHPASKNTERKKYSAELTKAQTVCNSVIPQKFGRILKRVNPQKNILLGYKDETIGQIGYGGSGKKVVNALPKGVHFRWTWSLGDGRFIKCLIMSDRSYKISLERY